MFNERQMTIDVRRSQMQPEYSFVRATNNFLLRKLSSGKYFFICKLEVQGHAEARHQTGNPSGQLWLLYSGGVPQWGAPMQRHNNGEGCHRCLVFSDAFCTALCKFNKTIFSVTRRKFLVKEFSGWIFAHIVHLISMQPAFRALHPENGR